MSDTVNHPSHYGGDTEYETIKVLRAWLSPEEFRGFLRGNAIKYQSRLGKKGERSEDAAKSAWYAEELRKFEVGIEAEKADPFPDLTGFEGSRLAHQIRDPK